MNKIHACIYFALLSYPIVSMNYSEQIVLHVRKFSARQSTLQKNAAQQKKIDAQSSAQHRIWQQQVESQRERDNLVSYIIDLSASLLNCCGSR